MHFKEIGLLAQDVSFSCTQVFQMQITTGGALIEGFVTEMCRACQTINRRQPVPTTVETINTLILKGFSSGLLGAAVERHQVHLLKC